MTGGCHAGLQPHGCPPRLWPSRASGFKARGAHHRVVTAYQLCPRPQVKEQRGAHSFLLSEDWLPPATVPHQQTQLLPFLAGNIRAVWFPILTEPWAQCRQHLPPVTGGGIPSVSVFKQTAPADPWRHPLHPGGHVRRQRCLSGVRSHQCTRQWLKRCSPKCDEI